MAWSELFHGSPVYFALEGNDLAQRVPIADPPPAVELGLVAGIHLYADVVGKHSQQKPFLLLANADGLAASTHQSLRQTIAQPASGTGQNLDVVRRQADLL